jgi:hypothetical protein
MPRHNHEAATGREKRACVLGTFFYILVSYRVELSFSEISTLYSNHPTL